MRGTGCAPQFTWSDAWLLFAVALAARRGKATLKDVIARASRSTTPSSRPRSCVAGFAKLIASGHVTGGDSFDIYPEIHDMVARAEERGIAPRTLQKQLDALLEAARTRPAILGGDPVGLFPSSPTP